MQTVQDWLTQKASDTPQQSGGLKSVSEWVATQPPTPQTPVAQQEPVKTSFSNEVSNALKVYAKGSKDLFNEASQSIKNYANESADVARNFPSKVKHPIQSFVDFADSIKNDWMAGVTKAGTPVPNGNIVTDVSNLITGVAQSLFSPITGLFKAAESVPGLKQVADAINVPFTALGLTGSFVADKFINAIPDKLVDPETKDVIRQPLQDLTSLTAQLIFGGKVMDLLGDFGKENSGKKITTEELTKIVDKSKAELPKLLEAEQPIPIKPQTEQLTVKEWQEKGMPKEINKTIEPTQQVNVVKTEPVQEVLPLKTEGAPIEKLNSSVFERMKNENPELTGDVKYTPISLKEDVVRAGDILAKDRQEAFDIAMGKKASPDVTSTSVNIVMAEKALQDGNIELFSRLTKKRSLDQTRRGQEIVSEKSSVSDNSVSRYVRELIDTRLNLLGNSYLGKAVEFVTKQSPKQKATKVIDNEVSKLTTKINSKKLDVKTALDLLEKLKCV